MKIILHNDETDKMSEMLQQRHADVEVFCCKDFTSLLSLLEESQAEAMFSVNLSHGVYPSEAVLACKSLRWISVGGSGTDHLGRWDPEHITVTNAAGAGAESMAQYVFAGLLSLAFDLPRFAEDKQYARWSSTARVHPISGKTMLIVGLGPTGREVARLAKSFGLTTLGVRARPVPTDNIDEVYPPDELDGLWSRADFVVVCVPLLPSTRLLVSQPAFEKMRREAVLIDVSRGGVVDQQALAEALETEAIAGAVRDVFEPEPLNADHPLWRTKNLIITPHCCSVFDDWAEKAIAMFSENLQRYKNGEALKNIVEPGLGY